MNDFVDTYDYPWEVKLRINQNNPDSYSAAADYINQSSTEIVCLQHEFGLFGGTAGEMLIPMLKQIQKPIVTCFHTIQPDPDQKHLKAMKQIIAESRAVIAMSERSARSLVERYGCNENKVAVIHHGVPNFDYEDTLSAKQKLGISAKRMIMVSGLISPGKGFEYVIEAMRGVVDQFPDTQLYIVGSTHPHVKKSHKEGYREQLLNQIKESGLELSVFLVDKFLELPELVDYYRAADIYITPHLDPQQPTSGTLAKALGAGKVCISTPYFYAVEMLDDDTGILVPFADADAITKSINLVLSDEELLNKYREKAYARGKRMQWPRVARKYLDLYRFILNNNE